MRINPANIQNNKQARAHTEAQRIMEKVDSVVQAVDQFDQSESDFNKAEGSVLVDRVVLNEGEGAFDVRTWANGAKLLRGKDSMKFTAQAQLPGSWGLLPMALDTEVTKTDSPESTVYKIKYEGSVQGPNTQVVEVDKETGEWNVSKKWMGIFPARFDS